MNKTIIKYITFFFIFLLINCSQNTVYSGKILSGEIKYDLITSKNILIETIGSPNFIDPIEKKYYYYSVKKISKNFYNNKIAYIKMIIFSFDENNNILEVNELNLDQFTKLKIAKDKTENKLLKRGLLEKAFGGIGNNLSPNTSQ